MKEFVVLLGLCGFIGALSFAGGYDMREAEQAGALYKEMVCLGRATNNQSGWPNYKNLDIDCGE